MKNQILFTPGPVPLPTAIAAAGSNVNVYHQSDAFPSYVRDLSHRLQRVFMSEHPVLMLSGSAMTGMDAAAATLQRASDTVLVLHHGRFGERLLDIARTYSDTVVSCTVPWGSTITVETVAKQCASMKALDVVWCVHSETSTGVSLDLQSIATTIRANHPHALICVDAVTSVAIQELQSETWGLDVVIAGIQKGFACSPGMALVAMSSRARERARPSRQLYTLDLHRVLANLNAGRMTWTPPTSLMNQLSVSVDMILERGLTATWQHHKDLYNDVRGRAEERGFSVWGDSTSRGVIVLAHPRGEELRQRLEHDYNMIIANGQDEMAGRVVRFGLCGSYSSEHYSLLFNAIDDILSR